MFQWRCDNAVRTAQRHAGQVKSLVLLSGETFQDGLRFLADSPNLIVTLGYQYAGPLPFQQFFIDTVAAWEKKHGKRRLYWAMGGIAAHGVRQSERRRVREVVPDRRAEAPDARLHQPQALALDFAPFIRSRLFVMRGRRCIFCSALYDYYHPI